MEDLEQAFAERLSEIEAYLEFLGAVETEAQSGPPRLGRDGQVITSQQQRILYSGVYLQLYNLVEATIVNCIDRVTTTAISAREWTIADLTTDVRREWVRVTAKTHTDLNYENRLISTLALCDHVMNALPIAAFRMEKGGGGNWDDGAIEAIADRLGCTLIVPNEIRSAVKRPFRDDLGPLRLVKQLRNLLAHGNISFAECGENVTVGELRDLTVRTADYLREVVRAFTTYIEHHQFVLPERRPAGTVA